MIIIMAMASRSRTITMARRKAIGAGCTTVSTFGKIVLTILMEPRTAMAAGATTTEEETGPATEIVDGAIIATVEIMGIVTVAVTRRTDGAIIAKAIAEKCQV